MSTAKNLIERFRASCVPAKDWISSLERDVADLEPPKLDKRPELHLPGDGVTVSQFSEQLAAKLAEAPLFNRNGLVMEILPDGKLELMMAERFCSWAEDHVKFLKWRGVGEKRGPEAATMTAASAALVLASPQFIRGLKPIRRVNQVSQPVIRSDGRLELLPAGYDAESQVYTLSCAEYDRSMPLEEAISVLEEVQAEFPWPREHALAARSLAVTSMVATFGDLLLDPAHQRPVWIFKANREGSGKTTLLRLAVCPAFGPAVISAPPNVTSPDALSKLLLSVVVSGAPYLALDNWEGVIGASALEAFITSSTYSDRLLGASRMVTLKKECLVFITGNNARVSPDMRRRSLLIDLEMVEATAENRTIRNPIGEYEILRMRPRLLAALWAIVRDWDAAGRPDGKHRHTSFAAWGHLFGGMMEFLGLPNPVAHSMAAADDTLRDFTVLLRDALEGHWTDERCFTASDLMEFARERGLFAWVIDSEAPEQEQTRRKERASFSKITGRFAGSRFQVEGVGTVEFLRGEDARSGENRAVTRQFLVRKVTEA